MDEVRMLDWVRRRTPRGAVPLARAISLLGATPPVWTAVGASALFAGMRTRGWGPLLNPICTLAVASSARRALAEMINRPRPPERLWLAPWSGPSFPSRHTTVGTVGAGLVAGALAPEPWAFRVVWPVAGAIGISRLVLGVHWPSDVVAGWVFAATTLTVARRARLSGVDGGPVMAGLSYRQLTCE